MDITVSFYQHNELPEISISGNGLTRAGFTPETTYLIKPFYNGVALYRLEDHAEHDLLMEHLEENQDEGADWVKDNGDIYLAGDYLTHAGLIGKPLDIDVEKGRIVIYLRQEVMLA